jgi:hypothetical protein
MARAHRQPGSQGAGPPERRIALRLLLEAHDTAVDIGWDVWMYACHIQVLRQQGVFNTTLRWLIDQGFAEHRLEMPSRSVSRRTFNRTRTDRFTEASCFALTDQGVLHARSFEPRGRKRRPVIPFYDAQLRTLVFAGVLVKEFHQPSTNQERLLCAFQELLWEQRIDDPLPPVEGIARKKRLSDTVYHLNKHQKNRLIIFECDGTGSGVKWRPTFGSASGVPRESFGNASGDKHNRGR